MIEKIAIATIIFVIIGAIVSYIDNNWHIGGE
jgi:hypothetical protein